MQEEFKAIIEKNLPAQVGEVLKTRLEKADRDSNTVKVQNDQIGKLKETVDSLENTIREYREFDKRNSELETRLREVADKERNVKIATLEYQLNSEKEKTQFSKDVALGLVRNTTYRENIFDNDFVNGYTDTNGRWVDSVNKNKTITKDNTSE